MVVVGINLVLSASFLMQSNWSAFFFNQLLCVRKEALGTRLSEHAFLLSFHTLEVGKAVARVRKKNIQAEVKYRKIKIVNKKGVSYKRIKKWYIA